MEQPETQLRTSRVKDSNQHDVLINAITESCDPYSVPTSASACLLNIATGKAVSAETQYHLTGRLDTGHKLHSKRKSKDSFFVPVKVLIYNLNRFVWTFLKSVFSLIFMN